MMDVISSDEPPARVLRLTGRLTFADAPAFRGLLREMQASGQRDYVLDLGGLSFLDSAAVGMLVILRNEADRNGWQVRLRLRGVTELVRLSLERSAFDQLFEVEA